MPLSYDKIPESLFEELDEVSIASKELKLAIERANYLPDYFPSSQISGICESLLHLKEGSSEGCRISLEYSIHRLTRVRRENVKIEKKDNDILLSDEIQYIARGTHIDIALSNVIVSAQTAFDEYRRLAADNDLPITTIEKPVVIDSFSQSDISAHSLTLEENILDARTRAAEISSSGQIEVNAIERQLIDVSNQNNLIRQEAQFKEVILSIYNKLVDSLASYPRLIYRTGELVEKAIDFSEPMLQRWNDFNDNLQKFVLSEIKNTAILFKQIALRIENEKEIIKFGLDSVIELGIDHEKIARQLLLEGKEVPNNIVDKIFNLNISGTENNSVYVERFDSVIKMPNLKTISMVYCDIEDRVDISRLERVEEFSFTPQANPQLAPLPFMRALSKLSVVSNGITETGAIGRCKNLRVLKLNSNSLEDIRTLKNCSFLKELHIMAKGVYDLSAIASLRNLEVLQIQTNGQKDNNFLRNLAKLKSFKIVTRYGKYLNNISYCLALQHVDIAGNALLNLNSLSNCVNIQTAIFNCQSISDFTFLKKLKKIKNLQLLSNKLSDISFLEKLCDIEELIINSAILEKFDALANLKNLKKLNLDTTRIHDLTPISNAINLEELSIQQTNVIDFKPLAKLSSLKRVKARGITPLNSEYLRGDVELIL